jgi:replicative DNA helicase
VSEVVTQGFQRMAPLYRPVADVVAEVVEEMHLRNEHPDLGGYRTGLECFDKHAREALQPGRLLLVAGESGKGKTAFAAQLAVSFSAQVPTLLVTLEDDERSTVRRQLANVSRESVGKIRSGFNGAPGVPAQVLSAADYLGTLGLDTLEAAALSVEQIGQQVWLWGKDREVGPDGGVIIIDQLSHIAPSSPQLREQFLAKGWPPPPPAGAREDKVLEWQVFFLRAMAKRLGVLVVLVHQLNENHGPDAPPTLRSIRDSRGIVHKSDLVVVPWRPSKKENPFAGPGAPKTIDAPEDEAELLILKGREVATAREQMVWIGAQQRFADVGDASTVFTPMPSLSPQAKEGARRLRELRERFEAKRAALAAIPAPAALELQEVESDDLS